MAISPSQFSDLALSLPQATAKSHMGTPDFRVADKIFATLAVKEARAVVKFTPEQQRLRLEADPAAFYPVKGAWGAKGWTHIVLDRIDDAGLKSALATAWMNVAPAKLTKTFALKDLFPA